MTRSERGSALVELVFVVMLLFTFLFAVIDFALIEASDNAGSNAAREGARAAILNVDCADLHTGCANPNPALQAITARAVSRLGGLVLGSPQVSVVCWDGSGGGAVKNCDSSILVPGVDLVEVDVMWTRMATSPYATPTTHTDKAKMTIEGSGQGTHSSSCQVVASSVTPAVAQIASGSTGPLSGNVTITAQTNALCQPLYVSFSTGSTPDQSTPVAMTLSGTNTFSYTIGAAVYNWAAGSYNLNLSESGVYQVNPAPAPVLTVTANACTITAASVAPSAVVLSGASSPGALAQGVTVSVTTTSACSAVNAVFNPGGLGNQVVAMTGAAPNWTLSIAAAAYSWTVGAKQFAFTTPATSPATPLQTPSSVILQVALRCAVSVSLSPGSITMSGNNPSSSVAVTATPSTGADCSGLTVTYQYAQQSSNTEPMVVDSGVYRYTIPMSTAWKKGSWSMTFSSTNAPAVSTSPSPVQEVVS